MPFSSRSKERASLRFEMRLSPGEREQLRDDAALAGISISELVRRRALGRPVHSAIDLTVIRELRRLGGLQKHAMNTLMHHRGIAEECIATIQALRAAVERVARDDR
jgi:DNA repair protein RadC